MPPGNRRGQMMTASRQSRGRRRRGAGPAGPLRRAVSRAAAPWRRLGRRGRAVTLGAVTVVAAWAITAALLAAHGPPPRARQYLAFTACLLTGPGGLTDAGAANAWAGLQRASLATRAKVQYLPVESGTTAADAAPYLASLTTRHCSVVVAVGSAQVGAVAVAAARDRSVRFAVVGGGASGPNVTDATGDAASVRSVIDGLVTRAVAQSTA
jgi:hypothetical protein